MINSGSEMLSRKNLSFSPFYSILIAKCLPTSHVTTISFSDNLY